MDAVPVGTKVAPAGFEAAPDQRCSVSAKPWSPGTSKVASEPERRWRSSEMCSAVMRKRDGTVGSPMDPMVGGWLGDFGSVCGMSNDARLDTIRSVELWTQGVQTNESGQESWTLRSARSFLRFVSLPYLRAENARSLVDIAQSRYRD